MPSRVSLSQNYANKFHYPFGHLIWSIFWHFSYMTKPLRHFMYSIFLYIFNFKTNWVGLEGWFFIWIINGELKHLYKCTILFVNIIHILDVDIKNPVFYINFVHLELVMAWNGAFSSWWLILTSLVWRIVVCLFVSIFF